MPSENCFDVAVLGAGLLGCFAARSLTRYRLKVALLEAREDVCTGISRANTAIVYTGYDTKPGTLKTRLCVQACRSFDELCAQLGVPFARRGSLMVSYGPRADRVLRNKYEQGTADGVPGLRLLSGAEAAAMEPNLAGGLSSALYAPGTGTVIPWTLGIAAYENAAANGCRPLLNTRVTGISPLPEGYRIHTSRGDYFAAAVINCCGLFADEIQEMVAEPQVRVIPGKDDYLVLDDAVGGFVRHIIFHEPEEKGKGLTLVPTVEGNLLLGPSEQPGDGKGSFSTTPEGLDFLRDLAAEVVPGLDLSQVIRSFGAVRPNPFHVRLEQGEWRPEERSISNFTVMNPRPGFWSLIGNKTPGMTCAGALGDYLAERVAEELGGTEANPDFCPVRRPPVRVRDLPFEQRAELVARRPEYGAVLCRCGGVTEGEVLDAIARGAVTLDGVKRRAGTGLGRCQGSFCTDRVMALLSRKLGVPMEALTKDGPGTGLLGGGCHGAR